MFKLLMYALIAYLAYKLLAGSKKLDPPADRDRLRKKNKDSNYSDYEEID
jgi:hypothetical protein